MYIAWTLIGAAIFMLLVIAIEGAIVVVWAVRAIKRVLKYLFNS
jgi:hypothetical protein